MRRRNFLSIAGTGLATVTIPIYIGCVKTRSGNVLSKPEVLSSFMDDKQICQLGQAYRNTHPREDNKEHLKSLINSPGKETKLSIREHILSLTREDFQYHRTVMLEGWILSRTEARQCALFSFNVIC